MKKVVLDKDYTGKETEMPISDLNDDYVLGVEMVFIEENDKSRMDKEKYCISDSDGHENWLDSSTKLILVDEYFLAESTSYSVLDMVSAIGMPVCAWFDDYSARLKWMLEVTE